MGCMQTKPNKFNHQICQKIKKSDDCPLILDSARGQDFSIPQIQIQQGMVSKCKMMFPDDECRPTYESYEQQSIDKKLKNNIWSNSSEQIILPDIINFQVMDNKNTGSHDNNSIQGIMITKSQQSIQRPLKQVKFDLSSNHIHLVIQTEKLIKAQIRQKKLQKLDKRQINLMNYSENL
ncbi:hypothetical protein pb186bvf_002850 [Paramecium bursaria]